MLFCQVSVQNFHLKTNLTSSEIVTVLLDFVSVGSTEPDLEVLLEV